MRAGTAWASLTGLGVLAWAAVAADAIPLARQGELLHLLVHDCGACHGMRMTGGLGPALTPTALASKSNEALVGTILAGRPGTPMPPWAGLLSEPEAWWIARALREGLPHAP